MTGTDFSTGAVDADTAPTSRGHGFMLRARGVLSRAALGRCAGLVAVGVLLGGCGNIEPWVKPYERQAFADPIMALDANPVSSSYIDHVYEARESARGAVGSSGGGCGCN